MSELTGLTLAAARDGLRRAGVLGGRARPGAHVAAIERHRALNAFITETPERALAMAEAADARLAAGEGGLLEGVPLAIKDLFCTEGVLTTAGSHILDGFVPPYESTVTRKLWEAGAVCLGKTNLDEFAMGSSNMTSYYGGVRNPWTRPGENADAGARRQLGRLGGRGGRPAVPGGHRHRHRRLDPPAGGASAASSGIKPTYGRCSRWGIVAFASSLDQAGPMARTVEDCALMLQAMAGHDPMDSTSADMAGAGLGRRAHRRCARPADRHPQGICDAAACRPRSTRSGGQGADWLRAQGAELVEVSLPHTKYALPTYYIIAPAEASSNLARYDGMRYGLRVEGEEPRRDLHEDPCRRLRRRGAAPDPDRHLCAVGRLLRRLLPEGAEGPPPHRRGLQRRPSSAVDAILTPTAPSGPFRAGEKMDDPVAMYLNDVFTVTVNLAGLPGISVPGRPRRQRPAARPAGDRPRLGRGHGVPAWARRSRRRPASTTLPYGLEAA